jgi:hypothetical protein
MLRGEEAATVPSTEIPVVVERRCRSGTGPRRRSFSVPRSGVEAQGAEEQRKKKVRWG